MEEISPSLASNTSTTSPTSSMMTRWLAVLEERSDPRVSDWLLMSSPLPTVLLCLTYLLVVKYFPVLIFTGRSPRETPQ